MSNVRVEVMMGGACIHAYTDDMAPYIAGLEKGDVLVLKGVSYMYTGLKTVYHVMYLVCMTFVVINAKTSE